MIEIEIGLFGTFRQFEDRNEPIRLFFETEPSVDEVKECLFRYLSEKRSFEDRQLLNDTALATVDRVLQNHEVLTGNQVLTVLPPVCGG